MSNEESTLYVATMALSGLSIPLQRVLDLVESKVLRNQQAAAYEPAKKPISNVFLPSSAPPRVQRLSRFVVVREAPASGQEVVLPQVRAIMEFSILPLRLTTPATIHLDALWIRPGTEADAMQQGLDQPALEPYGEAVFVELTSEQCTSIEGALPYLRYAKEFADPIDRFTGALMHIDRVESALRLLVAMELLVDPGGKQRDRGARVARRAASLAAADAKEQRRYRKIIERAYKCRPNIWHGEGNAQQVEEARLWLNANYSSVRFVASLAFQRALGNLRYRRSRPWNTLVEQVDHGEHGALQYVQSLPRLFYGQSHIVYNLDPQMFTAVGVSSTQIITGD